MYVGCRIREKLMTKVLGIEIKEEAASLQQTEQVAAAARGFKTDASREFRNRASIASQKQNAEGKQLPADNSLASPFAKLADAAPINALLRIMFVRVKTDVNDVPFKNGYNNYGYNDFHHVSIYDRKKTLTGKMYFG